MDLSLKTVIYEQDDVLNKYFADYSKLGFDCVTLNSGVYQELFVYNSQNKVDILVVNDLGMDRERLSYILQIVYNNYCKNILIITETPYDNDDYYYLDGINAKNFDLRLSLKMLQIKQAIGLKPSRNIMLLNQKARSILGEHYFLSKHDGFKYFIDAVTKSYVTYPNCCPTMELYKIIAQNYGKTVSAVEKSMRSALLRAIERVNKLPLTSETAKLKNEFNHTLTNNSAVSLFVGKLMADTELMDD